MQLDPVLMEIYSTVLEAAPYVIAAYALLWVGLMLYVTMTMRRVSRLERQVVVLEDAVARRNASRGA